MSLLPNDPTVQGKALFDGTQSPYTQDDAGDKKDSGGNYSHNAKAASAHTFQSIVDWLLYVNSILKGWTLTGIADGYVMRWVAGSASWVAGKLALTSIANIATDRILGNASGSPAAPAEITCTAAGRAILDDATNTVQRATLVAGKWYGASASAPTADGPGIYKNTGDGKWYASNDGTTWEALT
jgi:hypothetical protein